MFSGLGGSISQKSNCNREQGLSIFRSIKRERGKKAIGKQSELSSGGIRNKMVFKIYSYQFNTGNPDIEATASVPEDPALTTGDDAVLWDSLQHRHNSLNWKKRCYLGLSW